MNPFFSPIKLLSIDLIVVVWAPVLESVELRGSGHHRDLPMFLVRELLLIALNQVGVIFELHTVHTTCSKIHFAAQDVART